MAEIGGLSGTTSSSLYGLRGYGGLASGLDRDTLIEGMTQGTNNKIYKQQQKKTLLEWEQTAIRGISDKMIDFAQKYLNTFSSTTNLFSDALWGRNVISVLGANSKFVSVAGTASTADTLSILGVKQLAKKAQMTSSAAASDRTLKTGDIDLTEIQKSENLAGKTITIEYGNRTYDVTLPTGKDGDGKEYKYDTVENIADALNRAFANEDVQNGKKLSEVIKVETDGSKITFKSLEDYGNTLNLAGGTALSYLGFTDAPDSEFEKIDISTEGISSSRDITDKDIFTEKTFEERIAGKELTFTYNGVSKSIKMPSKEELEKGAANGKETMEVIQESMQKQLDDAFGAGRVKAEFNKNTVDGKDYYNLSFKMTVPGGSEDKTSTLTVTSGDSELLGDNGALKMNYGESNRVNLGAKISESGLNVAGNLTFPAKITINGTEIEVKEDDTVIDLMERINESDAGVEVKYQSSSDSFVFTAKANGASGKIDVDAEFEKIFGTFNKTDGQDAIVAVKYAGFDEPVELIRDSNSFNIDGMTISVNGEFGYTKDADGKPIELDKTSEAVTFDAKADEDKIVETVKKMVEEYNEIIELVNKETGTKPNRDYQPLTAAQKKELSEDEIKAWEEKAKEGLLFNDNDLKGLSNGLRFVLSPANQAALQKIGLSTSTSALDNGKISFDESKFRAALKADPEGVREMFAKDAEKDENGNPTGMAGIATNMKEVFDQYVRTMGETKGILIERAGSVKAPASVLKNSIYEQLQEMDKRIAKLQSTLKMEQDRYIKQFTSLESVIAQMNSQSSWLAQIGGGY
ncbi:flagellar filament capping protein FliD [Mediterraneibacter agrestimuris]|uniref:flagellar filament capping protein FliD n=1 Tax=Mediterraneibacter agrestimuris TaxID=2941333 RepID=UPI00203D9F76|nr:flagellar filament capping protein FliD [Mediterraneibacter agrestimuris]